MAMFEMGQNGNYKHGRYTAELVAARRWLRDATRMLQQLNQSTERKQGQDTSR